jgi:hypothetical protein
MDNVIDRDWVHSVEAQVMELESSVATDGLLFEKLNVTAHVGAPTQIIGSSKVKVNVRLLPALKAESVPGVRFILAAKEDSASTTCKLSSKPEIARND